MLKQVLLNLKILSKVPKGGRIKRDSNGNITLENDNQVQGIMRFYQGNSRDKAVEDINDVINGAFELAQNLMDSKYVSIYEFRRTPTESEVTLHEEKVEELMNLKQELINCKKGITNLKETTYKNDASIGAQLELCIHNVETKVDQISLKLDRSHFKYVLKPEAIKQSQLVDEDLEDEDEN